MAACLHCGAEIGDEVKFCPECGAGQGAKAAPPPPVATQERAKRRVPTGIVVVAVIAVIAVCGCLAAVLFLMRAGPSEEGLVTAIAILDETNEAATAPESTSSPKPTALPAPTLPPYAEITENVQSMTEIQWKKYLDGLDGHRIENWTGWVTEVDVSLSDKYTVWIDMDPPGTLLSTQDVYIPVPESVAFELEKGMKVTFSGDVDTITELLGSVSFRLKEGATLEY